MAQQLGIKVKIDLPSKSQLEREFRSKWKDFKADFTAKINVEPDGSSLRKMGAQIKRVLDGYNVEIKPKLDLHGALGDMTKLARSFRSLREEAEKGIHVNLTMDKLKQGTTKNVADSFKQQSKEIENAGRKVSEQIRVNTQREAQAVESSLNKLTRTTRMSAKGLTSKTQVDRNLNDYVREVTAKSGGNTTTKLIYDQKNALNQLKSVLKEIAALETKNASSNDAIANSARSKRIDQLKEDLRSLTTQYKATFNEMKGSGSENSFGSMKSEIESVKNLNIALATSAAKAKQAKSALRELTSIENSKFSLSMKALNSGSNEQGVIRQQVAQLEERARIITKSANLEKLFTAEQREGLGVLRTENSLRMQAAQAKSEDKAKAQAQLQTYRTLKSDLSSIVKLEREISQLEGKTSVNKHDSQSESRLTYLRSEIKARKDLYNWERKNASESGNLSKGASQNLAHIQHEVTAQKSLNRAIGEAAGKVAQSSHYYGELSSSISRATGLQRELSNAGKREAGYIREQIAAENAFQSSIKGTIAQLHLQNAAQEKQIATQRRQAETSGYYDSARTQAKGLEQKRSGGISTFIDPFNAIQQSAYGVAAAIGGMNELDQAITRVTKVADAPKRDLDAFTKSIYKNASSVGKSAPEYASAVEQWATAGFKLKDSVKLAKDSVMGSFVGDIDVNDMVKYMAVPLNAFKKQMLSSKDIINAMNEVANKNAIEMDDLGQAYSKAASTVSTTGTSFSQLTGLITAAQEGTRAGGDVIGRAIKSISINLNNMGSGLTAVSKGRAEAMEKMGIHFRKSNGEMKSTYQILGNIHKVWGNLSKDQKNQVSYYAAGKEQASRFQAIIKNWGTAQKATAEAQKQVGLTNKTQGSAFKEFAKQQNSIEFHLVKVKNGWAELRDSVLGNREGMNSLLDGATKVLSVMTSIAKNKITMQFIRVGAIVAAVAIVHAAFSKLGRLILQIGSAGMRSFERIGLGALSLRSRLASDTAGAERLSAALVRVGRQQEKNSLTDGSGLGSSKRSKLSKAENAADGISGTGGRIAKETETATGALGRFGKVSKVILGVGRGLLGLIPIVGDVVAVIGLMDAMGIRPWEKLTKGTRSAKDSLSDLRKEIVDLNGAYQKNEKSLGGNSIFNGKAMQYKKEADSMGDVLKKAKQNGQTQLDDASYQSFKAKYNAIAKQNHLKLRITLNNYDSLKEQLDSLNSSLKDIARTNVDKGVKKVKSEVSGLGKLNGKKLIDNLMGSDQEYTNKLGRIQAAIKAQKTTMEVQGVSKEGKARLAGYRQQIDELNKSYQTGTKNAELWSSKAGKAITDQWDKQTKSIRTHMKSLSDAINSDMFNKTDFEYMSKSSRNHAQVAEGGSLEKLGQKQRLIDGINKKLASGGKLNMEELKYLADQNSSLAGKSQNTSKWSAAEKQAAQSVTQSYGQELQKQKAAQEGHMRDILAASGKSVDAQNKIIAAYEKGGASYIKLMANQGNLGKSMLNVSAQFAQQYGKNWGKAYQQIQQDVDSVPKTVQTEYSLIDKSTGLVDTKIVAKLNSIPHKKVTQYGFKYKKDGTIDMKSVAESLNKLPSMKHTKYWVNGAVDANKLLDDLINHTNRVPKKIMLQYLANTTGFHKGFKDVLQKVREVRGKKATAKFLADNHYFGLSKKKVDAWLAALDKKKSTSTIDADNSKAKKKVDDVDHKKPKKKTVDVDADTSKADKKVSNTDNKKTKKKTVDVDADTSKADKKIGDTDKKKPKKKSIKVDANTSSADKKISSTNSKRMKNKNFTVTAKTNGEKNVSALKNSVNRMKGKKVTASAKTSGKGSVDNLRGSISKFKGKTVRVSAKTSGKGSVDSLHNAISRVKGKTVRVSAKVSGKGSVDSLRGSISRLRGKTVHVAAKVSGKGAVDGLANSISRVHDKTAHINIETNKTNTVTTIKRTRKAKSVAIGSEDVVSRNPAKSLSVAVGSDKPAITNMAANHVAVRNSSDSTEDQNARVDEGTWRYWGNELYTGNNLDAQVTRLENALTRAKDDMDKLISIARQRIDLDNRQISYQNSMRNAYQDQLNSVINQLTGYGFNHNGNQITNFNHARDLKGDQATKAGDLLNTYKTVYESLQDINNKIETLNQDKWQQQANIDEYNQTKESNNIDRIQKAITALSTTLSNNASIFNRALDEASANDYALKMRMSEQSINNQISSVKQLGDEFNRLSKMSFSNSDQATKIQSSLESIKTEILSSADAIVTLRKQINDLQLGQITADVTTFTNSLNTSIDRLKTNVTDLQDGLLSGQSFNDLGSSNLDIVDFNQATGLNSEIQARLNLEQQLDTALDGFAKKNVDRTTNIANAQLQIEQNKYSQLLSLANSYNHGNVGNISLNANVSTNLNLGGVQSGNNALERQFESVSQRFASKLETLKQRYQKALSDSFDQDDKDSATQQFIVQQLELQRDIYQEMIDSDKQSISALKEKLKLQGLTTDQIATIKDSIASYEAAIVAAQTSIKDTVKSRFDYENTLIQNQITKYKDMTDAITQFATLAKTLNLDTDAQGRLLSQQYASTFYEYGNYLTQLKKMRAEQKQYTDGSYEYNTLQTQIDTMIKSVESTVASLIEVNKQQLSNSLSGIKEKIEKSIYGGQTSDQNKFSTEIWYKNVDKELELETLRMKANDLEDNIVEKRLEALDAQKDMSKIEADYLDKQIDVYSAKEKLDNVSRNKNVQVLTSGSNGFNWGYEANQTDVSEAQKAYNSAEQAFQQYKTQQRDDYASKVETVISGIEDGTLKPDEAKSRLGQLTNAYKIILSDIPEFNSDNIGDIITQYNNYVSKNKDILDNYGTSKDISSMDGYQELITDFGEQFKSISKDLGDIFGKELRNMLSIPNVDTKIAEANKSVVIESQTIELPNVTDADGFKEAFKTLPDIAKQMAQGKK